MQDLVVGLYCKNVSSFPLCFSSSLVQYGVKKSYRSAVFSRMRESDLVISCSDENFKE